MPVRITLAAALGVLAALLVSCSGSGSGRGLIPGGNAGPLKSDFEAIAQTAQSAGGSCAETEAALAHAEGDLGALPASVDRGLRTRLREGLSHLRAQALAACAQQSAPPTTAATSAPRTTTSTQTTPSTPSTESTTTTTPSTTTTAPPTPGGGTPAPGEGEGEGEAEAPAEAAGDNGKHGGKKEKGAVRETTHGAAAAAALATAR